MGHVTVTYGTETFEFLKKYEIINLNFFVQGYFLYVRGIKKNIYEKLK